MTFCVLNEDKSREVKEEQLKNMNFISVTFFVLNLEKSNSIMLLHWQNIYAQLVNLHLNTNLIENVPLFEGINDLLKGTVLFPQKEGINDLLKGTVFPSIIKIVLFWLISFKLS